MQAIQSPSARTIADCFSLSPPSPQSLSRRLVIIARAARRFRGVYHYMHAAERKHPADTFNRRPRIQ